MSVNSKNDRNATPGHVAASEAPYEDEVMYANWNPMVAISAKLTSQCPSELSPSFSDDRQSVNAEEFLARIYALASQV